MEKAAEENRRLRDELAKAAMLFLEFLNRRYAPHAYATVTAGRVDVVGGEASTLFPVRG